MVYTLGIDEDGDYVPLSVAKSLYAAKCWDAWKLVKYKGQPKAPSVVLRIYKGDKNHQSKDLPETASRLGESKQLNHNIVPQELSNKA